MKFIPLRKKLSKKMMIILIVASLLTGLIVKLGTEKLLQHFIYSSQQNYTENEKEINNFFASSSESNRKKFLQRMIKKAELLIIKDAKTLMPLYKDNSFGQLRDFLSLTLKEDQEVSEAKFFVLEDNEIKAWQIATKDYPEGLDIPISYAQKKKSWQGMLKSKLMTIPDFLIAQKIKKDGINIELVNKDQYGIPESIIVTYPLIQEGFKNIREMKQAGEPIPFLSYTLDMGPMNALLVQERFSLSKYLEQMKVNYQKSLSYYKKSGEETASYILIVLCIAAMFIILITNFFISYFAKLLTSPINQLEVHAKDISRGNYDQNIEVTSSDELGVLATSFKDMCSAILKRDRELAELNKNLEKLVELRTQQLKNEMDKVQKLLDAMNQAVFTIDEDGKIISPVSKYSQTMFGRVIEGLSVQDLLIGPSNLSERELTSYGSALISVFGEDEIQWTLMENNLPSNFKIKNQDSSLQSLKFKYAPLWNEQQNLENIMYIVDDVTQVERLQEIIENEKKAGQIKIKIIEEISLAPHSDLELFFNKSFTYLEEIHQDFESKRIDNARIMRNAHTVKGNSQIIGFTVLADMAHHFETQMVETTQKTVDALIELTEIHLHYYLYARKFFRIECPKFKELVINAHQLLQKNNIDASTLTKQLSPILERQHYDSLHNDRKEFFKFVLYHILDQKLYLTLNSSASYLKHIDFKNILAEAKERMNGPNDLESISQFEITQFSHLFSSDLSWPEDMKDNFYYKNYHFITSLYGRLHDTNEAETSQLYEETSLANYQKLIEYSKKYEKDKDLIFLIHSLKFRSLQENLLKLVPYAENLASKFHKKIQMKLTGSDAYLDLETLNIIHDIIGHLIRNSIDHGIELPHERKKLNKNEIGQLNIHIEVDHHYLSLLFSDDGPGLNFEKIEAKLKTHHLSPEEIVQTIFKSGFSTKDDVSSVSGRGVGLDYVKSTVEEKLAGKITVLPSQEKGLTFKIEFKIPSHFKNSSVA